MPNRSGNEDDCDCEIRVDAPRSGAALSRKRRLCVMAMNTHADGMVCTGLRTGAFGRTDVAQITSEEVASLACTPAHRKSVRRRHT